MKGLAVIDGDLVLAGGDYYAVSGAQRIKQDLNIALHDEYGADRYHPYWGSIFDRYIGQPMTADLQAQVKAEVTRILNNYVAVQNDRINASAASDVRGVFDTSDVVNSIEGISVKVNLDSINITVALQTMARETVTITRQVTF